MVMSFVVRCSTIKSRCSARTKSGLSAFEWACTFAHRRWNFSGSRSPTRLWRSAYLSIHIQSPRVLLQSTRSTIASSQPRMGRC